MCSSLFFIFFFLLALQKVTNIDSDGVEADKTIASRPINSRVLRTWEDRVGMPGATHASRALPDQLTTSMFPSVNLMRRKQSQLSNEVSGCVVLVNIRFDD